MTPFDDNQPSKLPGGDVQVSAYEPPRIERLTPQDLEEQDLKLIAGTSPLGEEDDYY